MTALTRDEELTMAYRLGRLAGRDQLPVSRCPYEFATDPVAWWRWIRGYTSAGGREGIFYGRLDHVRMRVRRGFRRAWVGNEGRS